MKTKIDTFYALDFDRCLVGIDGLFNLVIKVIDEQKIISEKDLVAARNRVEATGGSFDVFGYIKKLGLRINLDKVESDFIKRALPISDSFLEPGASELIKYLVNNHKYFSILTYGTKRWQTTKIIAAGLGEVNRLIIPSKEKGKFMSGWKKPNSNLFSIPKECFSDNVSRDAKEIVLIDDKMLSFEDFPLLNARGYLTQYDSRKDRSICAEKLPKNVKIIDKVNEMIKLEFDK